MEFVNYWGRYKTRITTLQRDRRMWWLTELPNHRTSKVKAFQVLKTASGGEGVELVI